MSRKKEYCIIDGQEHELSPSMTSWGGVSWDISVCEVCRNYNAADNTCKIIGSIPGIYAKYERYDCSHRDIDEEHGFYEAIKRQLYPQTK